MLRPIANPLALGFVALAGATLLLAGQELHWIPASQRLQVAVAVLLLAPPLQLVACVFGFLGRDPVAATGMGLLASTWAVIGALHALSGPHARSFALGTVLLAASTGVALSALVAAQTKVLVAVVMGLTALRFLTTALFQLSGVGAIRITAGVLGCLLALVALYGAFAVELEGLRHATVLPTWRRGRGRSALSDDLEDQVSLVAAEPGVRNQL